MDTKKLKKKHVQYQKQRRLKIFFQNLGQNLKKSVSCVRNYYFVIICKANFCFRYFFAKEKIMKLRSRQALSRQKNGEDYEELLNAPHIIESATFDLQSKTLIAYSHSLNINNDESSNKNPNEVYKNFSSIDYKKIMCTILMKIYKNEKPKLQTWICCACYIFEINFKASKKIIEYISDQKLKDEVENLELDEDGLLHEILDDRFSKIIKPGSCVSLIFKFVGVGIQE